MRKWFAIGAGIGVALAVTGTIVAIGWTWYEGRPKPWDTSALVAEGIESTRTFVPRRMVNI